MKRLILVLFIGLLFLSCERQKSFIEVEILDITSTDNSSMITYKVINNSDFDISCIIDFKIDGTGQNDFISECETYIAQSEISGVFISSGFINSVDYKVKICEI